jgi:hypothetical protein
MKLIINYVSQIIPIPKNTVLGTVKNAAILFLVCFLKIIFEAATLRIFQYQKE